MRGWLSSLFFCSTCFATLGSFWSFPIDFFSPNCVSIEVKNVALQICWLVISLQSFCDKKHKILVLFCQPVLFPGLVLTAERQRTNHFFSDGWQWNYFPTKNRVKLFMLERISATPRLEIRTFIEELRPAVVGQKPVFSWKPG